MLSDTIKVLLERERAVNGGVKLKRWETEKSLAAGHDLITLKKVLRSSVAIEGDTMTESHWESTQYALGF